jgi:hypothetical protein
MEPARCAVLNVGASFPIRIFNRTPGKIVPLPPKCCDLQVAPARREMVSLSPSPDQRLQIVPGPLVDLV